MNGIDIDSLNIRAQIIQVYYSMNIRTDCQSLRYFHGMPDSTVVSDTYHINLSPCILVEHVILTIRRKSWTPRKDVARPTIGKSMTSLCARSPSQGQQPMGLM